MNVNYYVVSKPRTTHIHVRAISMSAVFNHLHQDSPRCSHLTSSTQVKQKPENEVDFFFFCPIQNHDEPKITTHFAALHEPAVL